MAAMANRIYINALQGDNDNVCKLLSVAITEEQNEGTENRWEQS